MPVKRAARWAAVMSRDQLSRNSSMHSAKSTIQKQKNESFRGCKHQRIQEGVQAIAATGIAVTASGTRWRRDQPEIRSAVPKNEKRFNNNGTDAASPKRKAKIASTFTYTI